MKLCTETTDSFEYLMILATLDLDNVVKEKDIQCIRSYRRPRKFLVGEGIKPTEVYEGPSIEVNLFNRWDKLQNNLDAIVKTNPYYLYSDYFNEIIRYVFKYPPELL